MSEIEDRHQAVEEARQYVRAWRADRQKAKDSGAWGYTPAPLPMGKVRGWLWALVDELDAVKAEAMEAAEL